MCVRVCVRVWVCVRVRARVCVGLSGCICQADEHTLLIQSLTSSWRSITGYVPFNVQFVVCCFALEPQSLCSKGPAK